VSSEPLARERAQRRTIMHLDGEEDADWAFEASRSGGGCEASFIGVSYRPIGALLLVTRRFELQSKRRV